MSHHIRFSPRQHFAWNGWTLYGSSTTTTKGDAFIMVDESESGQIVCWEKGNGHILMHIFVKQCKIMNNKKHFSWNGWTLYGTTTRWLLSTISKVFNPWGGLVGSAVQDKVLKSIFLHIPLFAFAGNTEWWSERGKLEIFSDL